MADRAVGLLRGRRRRGSQVIASRTLPRGARERRRRRGPSRCRRCRRLCSGHAGWASGQARMAHEGQRWRRRALRLQGRLVGRASGRAPPGPRLQCCRQLVDCGGGSSSGAAPRCTWCLGDRCPQFGPGTGHPACRRGRQRRARRRAPGCATPMGAVDPSLGLWSGGGRLDASGAETLVPVDFERIGRLTLGPGLRSVPWHVVEDHHVLGRRWAEEVRVFREVRLWGVGLNFLPSRGDGQRQ